MKTTTVKLLTGMLLIGKSVLSPAQNEPDAPSLKNALSVSFQPVTLFFWTHPGIVIDEEWGDEPKRTQLTYVCLLEFHTSAGYHLVLH